MSPPEYHSSSISGPVHDKPEGNSCALLVCLNRCSLRVFATSVREGGDNVVPKINSGLRGSNLGVPLARRFAFVAHYCCSLFSLRGSIALQHLLLLPEAPAGACSHRQRIYTCTHVGPPSRFTVPSQLLSSGILTTFTVRGGAPQGYSNYPRWLVIAMETFTERLDIKDESRNSWLHGK